MFYSNAPWRRRARAVYLFTTSPDRLTYAINGGAMIIFVHTIPDKAARNKGGIPYLTSQPLHNKLDGEKEA